MFGMNAKDAQGAMEEAMMLGAAQAGSGGNAEALYGAANAQNQAVRAIRVQNGKLSDLKSKFEGLGEDYSDLSAVALAERDVIDALADRLAKELKMDPAAVRRSAYQALTKRYDARVGEMLSTGVLKKDPRENPEVMKRPSRDWYTPEV
ncbi:hypothetical protein [Burkholderia ambifaria]|uniref:hypothetical protein n=1 Tax=Burkholderia ambifaria TaxID=152480 RepID=UPI002FDFDF96